MPSTVKELLAIGHKLIHCNPTDQSALKDFVLEATMHGIEERLAVGYARLLWITIEVSTCVPIVIIHGHVLAMTAATNFKMLVQSFVGLIALKKAVYDIKALEVL